LEYVRQRREKKWVGKNKKGVEALGKGRELSPIWLRRETNLLKANHPFRSFTFASLYRYWVRFSVSFLYWAIYIRNRSTDGYSTIVWGNLVTSRSEKQNVVAHSSVEVEYRPMAHKHCETKWLKLI